MVVAIDNNTDYTTSGYDATHTISSFACNGTDSHLAVAAFSRAVTTDLTTVTADGNTMTARGAEENTSVAGCEWYDYTISNASFNIVGNTPSFKLLAMVAIALSGINQTTAPTGTPVTGQGYGTSATGSYTGTSGNMLLVCINLQGGSAPITASNCTELSDFDHSDGSLGRCWVGYVIATGSSQTIGGTWTGDDNYTYSIVELAAEPGATPTIVRTSIIMG